MKNRKIKIDGEIKSFDISDGQDKYSFGMNGVGGMTCYVDGQKVGDNCHVENKYMLDGEISFKKEHEQINFSSYYFFKIDDERYERLKEIHKLDYQQCKDLPEIERVDTVLFGLKYFPIEYIRGGYHFGKELTYRDFCITFLSDRIVVYKSSHNGYIAPDYLEINSTHKDFSNIYAAIKNSINEYFSLND